MNKLREWFQGGMTDEEFEEFKADLVAYTGTGILVLGVLAGMNYLGAVS